eukprot:INCI4043.5.p1 GENE.INCI4043.5~~INCI4043.5.p1  ORF type:complete len:1665 (+),score=285.90 INCI4043.5:31-4995(+)
MQGQRRGMTLLMLMLQLLLGLLLVLPGTGLRFELSFDNDSPCEYDAVRARATVDLSLDDLDAIDFVHDVEIWLGLFPVAAGPFVKPLARRRWSADAFLPLQQGDTLAIEAVSVNREYASPGVSVRFKDTHAAKQRSPFELADVLKRQLSGWSKLSVNVADGPDCDGSRMWLNGTTLFVPFVNITEDKLNETRNSSRASSLACIVASDSHQLADVDIWPRRSVLDWLFRVPDRGRYDLRLCTGPLGFEECQPTPRPQCHVHVCGQVELIGKNADDTAADLSSPKAHGQAPLSRWATSAPEPSFHIPTVLALDGTHGLRVAHEEFPYDARGNFTVSFWIATLIDANTSEADSQVPLDKSQFRGLFYKGPDSEQRTPAAWMLRDNRIVTKVSTDEAFDVGAENDTPLRANQWVHVTYVFENHTEPTSQTANNSEVHQTCSESHSCDLSDLPQHARHRQQGYRLLLYFDGVLDSTLQFKSAVLSNSGPMYVAKDPWLPGTRGLLSHFSIFPRSLTVGEIAAIHRSEARLFQPIQLATSQASIQQLSLSLLKKMPTSAVPNRPHWWLPSENHIETNESLGLHANGQSDRTGAESVGQKARQMLQDAHRHLNSCNSEALPRAVELLVKVARISSEGGDIVADTDRFAAMHTGLRRSANRASSARAWFALGKLVFWGDWNNADATAASGEQAELPSGPNDPAVKLDFDCPSLRQAATRSASEQLVKEFDLAATSTEPPLAWISALCLSRAMALGHPEAPAALAVLRRAAVVDVPSMRLFAGQQSPLLEQSAHHIMEIVFSLREGLDVLERNNANSMAPWWLAASSDDNVVWALHTVAALQHGDIRANYQSWAALGYRHQRMCYLCCRKSAPGACEASAFYYEKAARWSHMLFHLPGNQPLSQRQRLNAETEYVIDQGERGMDDAQIEYQRLRAEQGDIPSMIAMGGLYYYGARGLPRDQPQALRYFQQAALLGSPEGQVAAANMFLKGEGGIERRNITRAEELYRQALEAEPDNVDALNGLGFAYYHGSDPDEGSLNPLVQNRSRALDFFEQAADTGRSSDALFNAGQMHFDGVGTDANHTRAIERWQTAAAQFGNFDAIFMLGIIFLHGDKPSETPRDCNAAVMYLRSVAESSNFGHILRGAFDRFLAKDIDAAALLYLEAADAGYEVGQNNAAFLFDRYLDPVRATTIGSVSVGAIAKNLYLESAGQGSVEAMLRLGDFYFYGMGGCSVDYPTAFLWYSKAKSAGDAQATFNVGYMLEVGLGCTLNVTAARVEYTRSLEMLQVDSESNFLQHIPVLVTIGRLNLRHWLIELGWVDVSEWLKARAPYRASHGLLAKDARPSFTASVATITHNFDWETIAVIVVGGILAFVGTLKLVIETAQFCQSRISRHGGGDVASVLASTAASAETRSSFSATSLEAIHARADELLSHHTSHLPFSEAELQRALQSIANLIDVQGASTSGLNTATLRSILQQHAHTAYAVWSDTSKVAAKLASVLPALDSVAFKRLFFRVLQEGNWDDALCHAQQRGASAQPWAVLIAGLNGIRKTTAVHQPWFANALSDSLGLKDTEWIPTGKNSFFRQLDHIVATMANEEFRLLYQLQPHESTIGAYAALKDAIFARLCLLHAFSVFYLMKRAFFTTMPSKCVSMLLMLDIGRLLS